MFEADLSVGGEDGTEPPDPYVVRCAKEYGALYAVGCDLETPVEPSGLVGGIAGLVDRLDSGNQSAFSRGVGVSPNTVKRWRRLGNVHLDVG